MNLSLPPATSHDPAHTGRPRVRRHAVEPSDAHNQFEVWAPRAEHVELVIDEESVAMQRAEWGWWAPVDLPERFLLGEYDYGYLVDGDGPFPDPRSRWQPQGVHGLSRTINLGDYQWGDAEWTGRDLPGSVIYELHVGTFTTEGTLTAAIEKLDYLAELGVDLIELMPVNGFSGEWGWGYDGVLWFAVHQAYGGPRAYQGFVDACHARGMGVIQDVVYNHFGPSGNYLNKFGYYQDPALQGPWGDAINLDGEGSDEVRRYIIDNAVMWLSQYHVDGLRLDAVHHLFSSTAVGLLEELSIAVDAARAFLRRPVFLIAESDLNNPRLITPREAGGYGLEAQWSDDFHHALLANITGVGLGYYADFNHIEALAKVIETGFFHDGTLSSFRGRAHGRPLDPAIPMWRLVVCSDNHDQIGNRATGERVGVGLTPGQLRIMATLTLLTGYTPMIFMGEEWGATTPFQFFTSHVEPDLAESIRQGRFAEFARMDWDDAQVPDPQDPQTFFNSKLDWEEPIEGENADLVYYYRNLMQLRRSEPDLVDPRLGSSQVTYDPHDSWMLIRRGEQTAIVVQFGQDECFINFDDNYAVRLSGGDAELGEGGIWLGGHSCAVLTAPSSSRAGGELS